MVMGKLSASALAVTVLCAVNCFGGIITYTDESAWSAAVSADYVTEPFDATGLQSFTGVVSSAGSIGPSGGLLSGSVWSDRVTASGGESTTFSYLPDDLIGAGATWDGFRPGGEGQALELTLNLAGGGTRSQSPDRVRSMTSFLALSPPMRSLPLQLRPARTKALRKPSIWTTWTSRLKAWLRSRVPFCFLSSGFLGLAFLRKKLSF